MGSWIKRNLFSRRAPILGIERLRIETDGDGITTLVGFYKCPLRCKYCLNQKCHEKPRIYNYLAAEQVYMKVSIDNIYFQSSGGGITFGGGEPLLYPEYIIDFKKYSNPSWQINIETSLNVKLDSLKKLIPIVSSFIVDIKDINPDIYKEYTGASNRLLVRNLEYLSALGLQDRVYIRIPLIKGFNSTEDQENSEVYLRKLGYANFERFEYKTE